MQVMVDREQWRQLTGRVEIDDAYLGGEVQGGKAGRGSPNKVPFVAAVQTTESGQPVLMCLSQRPFTKESIQAFAAQSLAAPATLVSDRLGCCSAKCSTSSIAASTCEQSSNAWLGRLLGPRRAHFTPFVRRAFLLIRCAMAPQRDALEALGAAVIYTTALHQKKSLS